MAKGRRGRRIARKTKNPRSRRNRKKIVRTDNGFVMFFVIVVIRLFVSKKEEDAFVNFVCWKVLCIVCTRVSI